MEKAVTQARQSETVKKQKDILQGIQPDPPSANVDQISKKRGKGDKWKDQKDKPSKNSKLADKTPETKCTRCLGTPHSKQECPAKDSKCNKCLKKGHWAKACKSQLKKKVGEVYSCPEVGLEREFFPGQVTEVDMVERNSKESWKAEVNLNEHAVKFKVDTGADVTVLPPNIYHSLVPKPSLSKCDKMLMGSCKHKLCCLGNFAAKLCVDDKVITELIYVVKDLERPLLGREVAEKLKLVNRVDTVSSDDYKTKIASKHPQLFTGLSQMRETYTITLKEDAKQFAIPVARKVALPLYQKTKDELDMMLEETYCSEGWPDKHSVKDAMRPYWSTRGELTVVQNILLKGTRIVIPSSMRLEILDKVHEGHQGIAKCRERAKSSMWWPGLSREIQDLVQ